VSRASILPALVIGAGAGFALGLPLAYVVARWVSKATVQTWALTPVVVAAVDHPRGMTVTMESISQRSIPMKFAHDDFIRPEEASALIGKVAIAPLVAGDPLSWALVSEGDAGVRFADPRCTDALRARAGDWTTPTLDRVLDLMKLRENPQ
jgi:Flp pilus assembly protein CpaB